MSKPANATAHVIHCIRVDIIQEVEGEVEDSPVAKLLDWIVKKRIPTVRGGYAGPRGCSQYFPAEEEPRVMAWLKKNIKKKNIKVGYE